MKKNKFLKIGILLFILLTGLCLLVFNRCKFEEPAAPTWDVNFIFPLLSENYTMKDLAEDVKEINIKDDTVWVNIEQDIDSEEIGDKLKINGTSKVVTIPSRGSISDSVSIPGGDVILDSAIVKNGELLVIFRNLGSNQLTVDLEIKDLKNPDGTTFIIQKTISGNDRSSSKIDLANYTFSPPVYNGENYVRFDGSLTGGNGDVRVTVKLSELIFSSVTGLLDGVEVSIDRFESEFEIPEEFKDFRIQSADLKLALQTDILFPLDIDISIIAVECRGEKPDTIHIKESIIPSLYEPNIICINNIADFINSHPTKILIFGNVIIGDGSAHHTISENNTFSGTAIFNAPLIFSIPSYESKMEPDTLVIDEEVQDFLRDNLIEASFNVDINNGLPLGASLRIVFSNSYSDTTIFDTGNADLEFNLDIEPALTDGGDPAVVIQSVESNLPINLQEDELNHFINNDTLYYGISFIFQGSPNMIKFQPQDSIHIEGWVSAKINTKIPEDDEQ